jgi:hypothetical protein
MCLFYFLTRVAYMLLRKVVLGLVVLMHFKYLPMHMVNSFIYVYAP